MKLNEFVYGRLKFGRFMKNSTLLTSGSFITFITSIISFSILINSIGIENYGIYGAVMAFFFWVSSLDIQYYMILLLKNKASVSKKEFTDNFNTQLIGSILQSIIFLIIFFFILILFKTKFPPIFYVFGSLIFVLNRLISFYQEFLRANHVESSILKSTFNSKIIEMVLLIIFFVFLKMEVLFLFVTIIISHIFQLFFLIKSSLIMVKHKFYFNISEFINSLKNQTFYFSVSSVIIRYISNGAFFLSTFFLSTYEIGILSIIIMIRTEFRIIFSSYSSHYSPIISQDLQNNNKSKIIFDINNLTLLNLIGVFLFQIILFLTKNNIFKLIMGEGFLEYFDILYLFLVPLLLQLSFYPFQYYYRFINIKMYTKNLFITSLIYSFLAIVLLNFITLETIALMYTIANLHIAFFSIKNALLDKIRLNLINAFMLIANIVLLMLFYLSLNSNNFFFLIYITFFVLGVLAFVTIIKNKKNYFKSVLSI